MRNYNESTGNKVGGQTMKPSKASFIAHIECAMAAQLRECSVHDLNQNIKGVNKLFCFLHAYRTREGITLDELFERLKQGGSDPEKFARLPAQAFSLSTQLRLHEEMEKMAPRKQKASR